MLVSIKLSHSFFYSYVMFHYMNVEYLCIFISLLCMRASVDGLFIFKYFISQFQGHEETERKTVDFSVFLSPHMHGPDY